jgi:hypothetical protein
MEATTQDYLRKAAAEALAAKDDASVLEIIGLLQGCPIPQPPHQAQLALPSVCLSSEGPAHSYHYWVQFIRESFIPFMIENGRGKFTSSELFSWLENNCGSAFTTGDLKEYPNSGATWRGMASNALAALKQQGVLQSRIHSRVYSITSSPLTQSNP